MRVCYGKDIIIYSEVIKTQQLELEQYVGNSIPCMIPPLSRCISEYCADLAKTVSILKSLPQTRSRGYSACYARGGPMFANREIATEVRASKYFDRIDWTDVMVNFNDVSSTVGFLVVNCFIRWPVSVRWFWRRGPSGHQRAAEVIITSARWTLSGDEKQKNGVLYLKFQHPRTRECREKAAVA